MSVGHTPEPHLIRQADRAVGSRPGDDVLVFHVKHAPAAVAVSDAGQPFTPGRWVGRTSGPGGDGGGALRRGEGCGSAVRRHEMRVSRETVLSSSAQAAAEEAEAGVDRTNRGASLVATDVPVANDAGGTRFLESQWSPGPSLMRARGAGWRGDVLWAASNDTRNTSRSRQLVRWRRGPTARPTPRADDDHVPGRHVAGPHGA